MPHVAERRDDLSIRGIAGGRAIVDRQTIHVHDIRAEAQTEFPAVQDLRATLGRSDIACDAVAARR